MLIPIETLRVQTGLVAVDARNDKWITLAFDLAQDAIETFLDRKLEHAHETDAVMHEGGASLSLWRYPIDLAAGPVTVDGVALPSKWVNHLNGVVFLGGYHQPGMVQVDYTGGYTEATLPGVLQRALLEMFNTAYSFVEPDDGSGSSSTDKIISRVTLQNVGSVTFATGADAVAAAASSKLGLPKTIENLLMLHRRVRS